MLQQLRFGGNNFMTDIVKFTVLNLYALLGCYLSSYVRDTRIVDKYFCYEFIPVGRFRFFCLRQRNPQKMIRKITRDREILSIICFTISEITILIFGYAFKSIQVHNSIMFIILLAVVMVPVIIRLFLDTRIEGKCSEIVALKRDSLEVTEKNLSRCARNIMRKYYEGENRTYIIQKTQKKTFWYDYTEYHLYVDEQYLQTMVKQQKYRYSSIVETKWYR